MRAALAPREPGSLAVWSRTNVAKLDLEWKADRLPFCPKITTLRGGFGQRADEPLEICAEGRLQEHPLFGLNPRCIVYDGGVRFILLGNGCWAMFPVDISDPGVAFQTEFAALLTSEEPVQASVAGEDSDSSVIIDGDFSSSSSSSSVDVDASETRTHMARSQRIYSEGRLATASTAFLTLGGMAYTGSF